MKPSGLIFVTALVCALAGAHTQPQPDMYGSCGAPPTGETCARCHTGTDHVNNAVQGFMITELRAPDGSEVNGTYNTEDGPYTLHVELICYAQYQGGMEVAVLDAQGASAGVFYRDPVAAWFSRVQINEDPASATRTYVHHTWPAGLQLTPDDIAMRKEWTILWYPPSYNVGDVTFYIAALAGTSKSAGDTEGDYIYTRTLTLSYGGEPREPDLDRDSTLSWRDVFYFYRQWQQAQPTPTPLP